MRKQIAEMFLYNMGQINLYSENDEVKEFYIGKMLGALQTLKIMGYEVEYLINGNEYEGVVINGQRYELGKGLPTE